MKKIRIFTAITLILIMTFGLTAEASANIVTYDSVVTRRADLPNVIIDGNNCKAVNAMGVSRRANCLYTIKISEDEEDAVMYYFEDITDWDNSVWFEVHNVGHANGMTVDTDYIYICARENVNPSYSPNNKIVRIDRDYIDSLSNGAVINATTTNENCKVIQPKMINPVVSQRDTIPYVNYTERFSTIARAETTGTFIIGKPFDSDDYNCFTRASIIDGEFVVSTDIDDMFLVENCIEYKNAAKQDFCYVPGSGMFIGRWYRNYSTTATDNAQRDPTRNEILWANIEGARDSEYMGYDCYKPDIISVDVGDYIDTEFNVVKYSFFEVESLGITDKRNLIATFNVDYTTEYEEAYIAKYKSSPQKDGVYKITKTDGSKFVL